MNDIFKKGHFEPINNNFIKDSMLILDELAKIQHDYSKPDMDTLLNELHDSIVGKYLGFKLVNTQKHGFDCKLNVRDNIFLESKVASYCSSSWSATFNDTTFEKADAFRSKNVWLALSLWTTASDILCICFGQNPEIGDILERGVIKHKAGETVRSTQKISMRYLIFKLDFKILSPVLSAEQLIARLNIHNFKELSVNHVIEFKNFKSIHSYARH